MEQQRNEQHPLECKGEVHDDERHHQDVEGPPLKHEIESLLRLQQQSAHSPAASLTRLSRGGTTKVIDRLETMGYVTRQSDPADRRATVVDLTQAGRAALKRALPVIDAGLEEIWAEHLTDAESTLLTEVMQRVLEANHICG